MSAYRVAGRRNQCNFTGRILIQVLWNWSCDGVDEDRPSTRYPRARVTSLLKATGAYDDRINVFLRDPLQQVVLYGITGIGCNNDILDLVM